MADERATDQYTMQDPTTQYREAGPEFQQYQEGAGLEEGMRVKPDAGEQSYRGTGRLTGRKALVTGADSGIGRAVVIAFAREGADVVLSYLPEEEADAQEVVALVTEAGRKAVAVPGDLTDEAYCERLVQTTVDELGGIDILVSNAARQQEVPEITDLTTEQFESTFRTNVFATFWLCRAAVPHMPPGGSIITTSSIQAYQPSPILLDYASTKAAMNTFSKALAQQVASKGIRVNVVAPGPVWTPLQVAGGQPTEALGEFGQTTPLGRPGQPAEMAPPFVFLASQESSYVTGATLHANGGMPTP
jgi:NAD(P)-dependent dehydrogenase (short-subunit alcohol dehydrogenase family)